MSSKPGDPPSGWWTRPPTADDVPEIVRIVNRCTVRDVGMAAYAPSNVHELLGAPADEIHRRFRVAGVGASTAAWLEVDPSDDYFEGFIDPGFEGRGLGTALVRLGEEILREAGRAKAVVNVGNEDGCRLLENLGYTFSHGEHAMVYDLSSDRPRVQSPPDIDISPFREGVDEGTFYEVMRAGFGDDWANAGAGFEQWIARQGAGNYDPDLWLIARRAGVAVGVLEGRPRWGAQDDHGWVKNIAVLPDHRRHGIGRALLLEAFARFRGRGRRAVVLGVDADNPTKAPDFYLRVGLKVRGHSWDYEKELSPR